GGQCDHADPGGRRRGGLPHPAGRSRAILPGLTAARRTYRPGQGAGRLPPRPGLPPVAIGRQDPGDPRLVRPLSLMRLRVDGESPMLHRNMSGRHAAPAGVPIVKTYSVDLRHAASKRALNATPDNRLDPLRRRLEADGEAVAWARDELMDFARRRSG